MRLQKSGVARTLRALYAVPRERVQSEVYFGLIDYSNGCLKFSFAIIGINYFINVYIKYIPLFLI